MDPRPKLMNVEYVNLLGRKMLYSGTRGSVLREKSKDLLKWPNNENGVYGGNNVLSPETVYATLIHYPAIRTPAYVSLAMRYSISSVTWPMLLEYLKSINGIVDGAKWRPVFDFSGMVDVAKSVMAEYPMNRLHFVKSKAPEMAKINYVDLFGIAADAIDENTTQKFNYVFCDWSTYEAASIYVKLNGILIIMSVDLSQEVMDLMGEISGKVSVVPRTDIKNYFGSNISAKFRSVSESKNNSMYMLVYQRDR